MADALPPESAAVRRTFVDAYGPYVEGRVAALGIEVPPGWSAVIERGAEWLADELELLLVQPMAAQGRSPLELLQEALRFPTEALAAAGTPPTERDDAARRALPGDLYDLAPASSQDLGEEAWRSHLAWGVAKAKEVAGARPRSAEGSSRPRRAAVALVGSDLMDRSRIEPIVAAAGFRLEAWRNPAAVEDGLGLTRPAVVLVDLVHPAADEAIRRCAATGVRCYAFGPHVDDIALGRAQALGATDVYPRSRFFRVLPDLIPKLA